MSKEIGKACNTLLNMANSTVNQNVFESLCEIVEGVVDEYVIDTNNHA